MELRRYLDLLRRRWLLIAACVIAGVAIGYSATPSSVAYRATAQLYVGTRQLAQDPTQLYAEPGLNQVVTTFADMIPTWSFAEQAVAATGVKRSPGTVVAETTATVVPGTTLIDVTVTDPVPAVAQKLADGISNAFVSQIQNYQPGTPAGPGSVPIEPAYLFQPAALPGAPLPHGTSRHVTLGGVFGLIVGVLVVLLLDHLDTSVRGPEGIERRLGLPVLAVVPMQDSPSPFRGLSGRGLPGRGRARRSSEDQLV